MSERPTDPSAPRALRRKSRYIRAQERREAQIRADQRFYRLIFGVITACALVVLGLAAIGTMPGGPVTGGSGEAAEIVRARFLGLSAIEWGALLIAAIAALFMWRRLSRK